MNNDILVSMINTRGRVVWVESSKVPDLRLEGWRLIVNPKENYYPQYDTSIGKVKEDDTGDAMRVIDNDAYSNVLGIITL